MLRGEICRCVKFVYKHLCFCLPQTLCHHYQLNELTQDTHPFNGTPFPGLLGSTGTRKVKLIWILLKQETVSGSGIHWCSQDFWLGWGSCKLILRNSQFVQDIHSSISLMRSACVVRIRFILHNFYLDWIGGLRTSPWLRPWWHPLGCMQVCTSLQTDNHASTPPLSLLQVRSDALPAAQPALGQHTAN